MCNKVNILSHQLYTKKGLILCYVYFTTIKKRLENRLMDMVVGEEGEGEMYIESSMEAYTLPYVKEMANGNSPCDSGNSNWGSETT